MLSHLGLNVADLGAASAYYDELLPELGYERFLDGETQVGYRSVTRGGGPFLFLYAALEPSSYSRDATGLQHLAFAVATRAEVDRVHDTVCGLGSTVLDPPRLWPQYGPTYYAMFWLDPCGMKLEAVCLASPAGPSAGSGTISE